jgi:hypothetical protein
MGESMNMKPTGYTEGEVKVILAPLLGVSADQIVKFAIIVTGPCEKCSGNDRFNTLDNTRSAAEYAGMTAEALEIRIEREVRQS